MSNSTYILDDTLLASKQGRFLNYFLDAIISLFLIFIIGVFVAFLGTLFGWSEVLYRMSNMTDLEGQIVFVVIRLFYYILTEGFLGRSIAKFITGTVVVDENGRKPSFGIIIKRSFCRIIPFDGLSFLGDRGWHDSISDTYVVNKKDLDLDIKTFHELQLIGIQESQS
jgi:uncharacterized RDD family membrane protein YckC